MLKTPWALYPTVGSRCLVDTPEVLCACGVMNKILDGHLMFVESQNLARNASSVPRAASFSFGQAVHYPLGIPDG